MSGPVQAPPDATLPRWLPWAFLGLLVLPFHPFWADFEQVRRGLLLGLTGLCLVLCRHLPPVRGERMWLLFVAVLVISAVVNLLGQWFLRTEQTPVSFQPWDAGYRVAHWLALLVVLRLGAATPVGFSMPLPIMLVATSLFGLMQRLGLGEIAGYGVEREPVSVFGNLNVASEWTAVAAIATAVLGQFGGSGVRRWLSPSALVLASSYLVVDQSRSGLVALPIGLLVLWALRRRDRGWRPLAWALGGAALGCLLGLVVPRPEPPDLAAANAEQKRSTATLDVRMEIARSSSRLIAENSVFGHGPGQFAIQYARVRSQAEIEASSHGRQFATEVRTAHDDWLELLVDGGVPALLLFAAAMFALQRGVRDKARLLPLFVLLLLMFVRAPLGNAPAVAVAFLLAGSQVPTTSRAVGWRRLVAVVLGLLLCGLGLLPVVANCLFAQYQGARSRGEFPPVEAVAAAAQWMPFEPRWLQVLAQEQMFARQLTEARKTAAIAVGLRPFDPQLYALLAEVLVKGEAFDKAEQLVKHALAIDPQHPELRMWLSWLMMDRQEPELAIAAVVIEPHAMLRTQLGQHFRALAAAAEKRGSKAMAARFAVEQHFFAALETLGEQSTKALPATFEHVKAMLEAMHDADLQRTDARANVVSALYAIDLGKPDKAIDLGETAKALGVPLAGWQREALGTKLEPLQRIEVWAAVLARH